MVAEKHAEFRGRAQFITIECPQRRCDLAPKTLIFKTKSKVFFWIPYSSMNDRTAPRVWPPFESRRSPSYLYCNTYGVNSTKWGGGETTPPLKAHTGFWFVHGPQTQGYDSLTWDKNIQTKNGIFQVGILHFLEFEEIFKPLRRDFRTNFQKI